MGWSRGAVGVAEVGRQFAFGADAGRPGLGQGLAAGAGEVGQPQRLQPGRPDQHRLLVGERPGGDRPREHQVGVPGRGGWRGGGEQRRPRPGRGADLPQGGAAGLEPGIDQPGRDPGLAEVEDGELGQEPGQHGRLHLHPPRREEGARRGSGVGPERGAHNRWLICSSAGAASPAHTTVQVAPSARERRTRCAHTASRTRAGSRGSPSRSASSSTGIRRRGRPGMRRPSTAIGRGPRPSHANAARAASSGNPDATAGATMVGGTGTGAAHMRGDLPSKKECAETPETLGAAEQDATPVMTRR